MFAGGQQVQDLIAKIRSELGEMLTRGQVQVDQYIQQLVSKVTTDKPWDRYAGYERMDILKRWSQGDTVAMTSNNIWKKDFYPKRFAIATGFNLDDKKNFNAIIGDVAKQAARDMASGIPVFEMNAFADTLVGSTDLLEDALDLIAYDGDNLFANTANRFGLATGNLVVPTYDDIVPDAMVSQTFQACKIFEDMKDNVGQFFHMATEVQPSDLIIVASNEYTQNWREALHSISYPKAAAVGSTGNVFTAGGASEPLAPPELHHNKYLSGKDCYYFLKGNFKPLRTTLGEYGEQDGGILSADGSNPAGGTGMGSSYQLIQTVPGTVENVLRGAGYIRMSCEMTSGVEQPQGALKFDIT